MVEEKWVLRYKATRFYFLLNYFFAGILLIILLSWLPFSNLRLFFDKLIFFGLLFVIIFLITEPELKILRDEYILSPETVIHHDALLRKTVEIPYGEIENLKIEQNPLHKFLDCGNVLIESNKERIKMVGINNPSEAYKVIDYKIGEIKLEKEKEIKELPGQKPEEKKESEETQEKVNVK
jgi:membrane protein YdbS with pleckstrin-like domain